jgi:hypothetical protein
MALDDPAATAEGDFHKTPLPHLLVYIADRRLTGALFLKEPQGTEHVVRFEWGAPVRVAPGDHFAMFGELLVEAGIVREEVVQGALATKGLLGDVLILTGHAEADELESVASDQLVRRMVRLFGLSQDTSYRYFDGHVALADAAPGCRADVLRVLLEGLRAHPRSGLSLSKLLERFGDTPLRMHPDALLDRFGFDEAEMSVVSSILDEGPALVDLLSCGVADAGVVRRVVYALLLTRQLEVGQKSTPLGFEDTPPQVALGRVNLASAIHRIGAAAPDPVGDGERAAVMPRTLRRRKRRESWQAHHGDPPMSNAPSAGGDLEEEPVSDVMEICAPGVDTSGTHAAVLALDPEHEEEPVSDVIETGPTGARARDTGTEGPAGSS